MHASLLRATLAAATAALALVLAPTPALAQGVKVGVPPPAVALPDAGGAPVTLASLEGQVVWVDFWASWCGPCRESFPWMNAMQKKYGAKGFKVVAINVDKRRRDADRFLAQVPAGFTTLFDDKGATPAAWEINAMPTSVLVDRKGKVVVIEEGFHESRREALEARIRALLEG